MGPALAKNIPTVMQPPPQKVPIVKDSMAVLMTDACEIYNIISTMKSSSSCGVDQIPFSVIKSVAFQISPILSTLINHSITSGIFPDALKVAKITPIFKTGDKSKITNYRPISVLNSFSKIYEKVFLNRLNVHLSKLNILQDAQFGFRKNRSTQLALLSFIDTVTEALDNNHFVVSLFLDLSKAFDTIDHAILQKKMFNIGIRGMALDYINNYLTNRLQFVTIDDTSSDLRGVTCGVPQGSILGPILFLIYINDLQNCSTLFKLLLFADDTTLLYSSKDLDSLITIINKELLLFSEWFNFNKLSLNISKTNYMLFSSHKNISPVSDITIGHHIIKRVSSTKFLGVDIEDNLTWINHTKKIERKLSSLIFVIRNIRHKINRKTALQLYDTLILSQLSYCVLIWGNTYKTHISNIFRLQKRALRLCHGLSVLTSDELFRFTNRLSFYDIHKFHTAKLVYRFFNQSTIFPKCIAALFSKTSEIHHFNTRSVDQLCLHHFFGRLAPRNFSTKLYAPVLWNKIPIHIRQTVTEGHFKNLYKSFLLTNVDS